MAAAGEANKLWSRDDLVPDRGCHSARVAVFLHASRLRRVRLVVRTQPSQGWYTGSTPVRAAPLLLA